MAVTSEEQDRFSMPWQLGVFLAVNAVSDAMLVLDGPACLMNKADLLAGSHDLFSTLLRPDARHRVVCTFAAPFPLGRNSDKSLLGILSAAASSGASAVLAAGAPFMALAGVDYAGIAAAAKGTVPVLPIKPSSAEAGWLEGYAAGLKALASALPAAGRRRRKTVAVAGYLWDRGEGDHRGNEAELRRLLGACGLELACIFPSGRGLGELGRAMEADLVVSLPYGRAAAGLIASRSGARLVETGLPMGLKGTSRWLGAVAAAAGLRSLPPEARKMELDAARLIAPLRPALAHRRLAFAGDPHLFSGFASLAGELGMRTVCALLDSPERPRGLPSLPAIMLLEPSVSAARSAIAGLRGYEAPEMLAGNSFSASRSFAPGVPFIEIGFPSYARHCLHEEPFLGYAGAAAQAGRLLNAVVSAGRLRKKESPPL